MKILLLLALCSILCGCPSITLPKVETKFCYTDANGELCFGSTKDGSVAFTGAYGQTKRDYK